MFKLCNDLQLKIVENPDLIGTKTTFNFLKTQVCIMYKVDCKGAAAPKNMRL